MENAFPWMVEDTTNNYAARATSQSEAGSPACYASKQGGMVDTKSDEYAEVTPNSLRIRKIFLKEADRRRLSRD